MRDINSILYWENNNRIKKLSKFKKDIESYFQNSKFDALVQSRIDNDKAKEVRSKILEQISTIEQYIYRAGISPFATKYPAPIVGGYVKNINLIQNLFLLTENQIDYQNAFDVIDKAIGAYKNNIITSIIRVINPFFYITQLIRHIVGFIIYPFTLFLPQKVSNIFKETLNWILYAVGIYQAWLWWGHYVTTFIKKML